MMWTFQLESGQEKEFVFSYTVQYPQDKTIRWIEQKNAPGVHLY